jgi:protein-S-isoprenylcysteine O-methyltransferase Ste14
VRKTIKKDLLFFGIPAFTVFLLGLIASAKDGYDGLVGTIWDLITHPETLRLLSAWNIVGLCLFIVGLSIAIVAACTLKRFYSSTLVTREDHQLITHGVYRFARHPLYLGVLIAIMGAPVYAPSLYGFLILSLLIPIFLFRIKIEEDMLTERFGDEYQAYRRATKKLVPFLY